MIMKRLTSAIFLVITFTLTIIAQELPQYVYNEYQGWQYAGNDITPAMFSRGAALYVNSQGNAVELVSPCFPCQELDSIAVTVKWLSTDSGIGLTIAIDDDMGSPCDSIHCMPQPVTSMQTLVGTIAVPAGLTTARLRFVSWDATVNNCGTIKEARLSAISGTQPEDPHPVITGDVDGNGKADVADVTVLIDALLSNSQDINTAAADVDMDGSATISDVTALIDKLLSKLAMLAV